MSSTTAEAPRESAKRRAVDASAKLLQQVDYTRNERVKRIKFDEDDKEVQKQLIDSLELKEHVLITFTQTSDTDDDVVQNPQRYTQVYIVPDDHPLWESNWQLFEAVSLCVTTASETNNIGMPTEQAMKKVRDILNQLGQYKVSDPAFKKERIPNPRIACITKAMTIICDMETSDDDDDEEDEEEEDDDDEEQAGGETDDA